MKRWRFLLVFLLSVQTVNSQVFIEKSDSLNKKRFIGVSATSVGVGLGSILALKHVWYDDFAKSPFHFFDDSHEWGQMDKLGHFYIAHHFSTLINDFYQWSGVEPKKAALIGGAYSLVYMTSFEFLDAYNTEWGFSLSDIGFNLFGTASSTFQTYFWNERRINIKFSVHNSGLADYRPAVLGNDFASRTLKDYNGQTYWLSFNPLTWSKQTSLIPNWLNISLGYSINNQLIGDGGSYILNDGSNQLVFTPYRQYFLSLDVDFEKIKTNSRALQILFRGLNCIKIPFPALEYSQGKLAFRPFYF